MLPIFLPTIEDAHPELAGLTADDQDEMLYGAGDGDDSESDLPDA
jgi:hypothetical protein